jgi:uncharacterized protein (TIGR03437 family)
MFRPLVTLVFFLACASGQAQPYIITTIAGGAPPVTPAAAASASIGDPPRVAVDNAGSVYFGSLHSVFKVDAAGNLTRIAGTGRYGFSGDGGPPTSAQLTFPLGIAADNAGNVYVVDHDADVIRRISAAGVITTYAGTGTTGYAGDGGLAINAQFRNPTGLGIDSAGNLYVADTDNCVIRKITRDGTISTIVGDTSRGVGGDGGPALQAELNGPEGIAVDTAGNLYIADTFNHRIRRVAADGTITTFAGNGYPGYGGDNGPAASATLQLPPDVAVDRQGNVYIADLGGDRIRKVSNGIISTVAGSTSGLTPTDLLSATTVLLSGPTGVAVDGAGNIYFAEGSIGSGSGLDTGDFRVWRVATDGTLFTLAGNGLNSYSGDNGPAAAAQLDGPAGMAADAHGNLYFADTVNNRIRRISPDGQITTVAGAGPAAFAGDGGPATSAFLNQPMGVTVDSSGNLFIADTGNNRVRSVTAQGIIGTVAGNGNAGYFGDGSNALSAALHAPRAVAIDNNGTLYIADTLDHRVRTVINGVIDIFAGRGQGFGGDGGNAVNALLNLPSSLAVDSGGNVYIADEANGRVRKVSPLGVITTVASGLADPRGVALDSAGNLYVTEAGQNDVRRIGADGSNTVIAGNGQCCYTNDGAAATTASLNSPWGVAVGPNGNIYVADSGNNAIRMLLPAPANGGQGAVTNAASNLVGSIAPGEIVVIYGAGIGPAQPAQFQTLNSLGLVGTQLGGVSVLFNGIYAPMLYASSTQVTAVVPYEASGSSVQVLVQFQSRIVLSTSATLAATAPGLFTADSSGKGQVLATNADGTLNGPAHPARAGSVVTMFGTGEGATTPAGVDGKPAASPLPMPVATVSATIGGQAVTVQYAGGAPGNVAGEMQINVQIPASLGPGTYPIAIQVGGFSSQVGVTIVVGGA